MSGRLEVTPRSGRRWPVFDSEIKRIEDMWRRGVEVADIALDVGIPPEVVGETIRWLGLSVQQCPDANTAHSGRCFG